ncbi:MAG: tetratricopeptide repeat protein [Bacteroidetes bacterium]|nr:tetratricopeptide repeat protein [Bacteroidota bacterium]
MKNFKFIFVLFMLILFAVGSQESFSQSLRGLVNEGVENYNEGNFSDAEVNFKKGVEKSPESFEAKFNLGDAFFKQERYDEAIKSYNSALAFAKNDLEKARVHYNIGNSLLKAQKIKDSIEEYIKSLKLNPGDQEAKYNLSYALELLKNKDDQQQQKNDKDQNKDKNGDQNKDQDKKDQQKDQQNKQDQQKQDQQDKKQQQPQQRQKISKEEAERILEALKDNEKDLQKELRKIKGKRVKTDKDW